MKVTLVLLARAGDLVGKNKRVHIIDLPDESTLYDLVIFIKENISRRLGEGILSGRLIFAIYVNGTQVLSLDTSLRDGDRVVITTPEMGG